MLTIKAEVCAGLEIQSCIQRAIDVCLHAANTNGSGELPTSNYFYDLKVMGEFDHEGVSLTFEFNDVIVTVCDDSDSELIYRDWSRAFSDKIGKKVGPYPNPVLTDEEKENDARIEAENEAKRREFYAEHQAN